MKRESFWLSDKLTCRKTVWQADWPMVRLTNRRWQADKLSDWQRAGQVGTDLRTEPQTDTDKPANWLTDRHTLTSDIDIQPERQRDADKQTDWHTTKETNSHWQTNWQKNRYWHKPRDTNGHWQIDWLTDIHTLTYNQEDTQTLTNRQTDGHKQNKTYK